MKAQNKRSYEQATVRLINLSSEDVLTASVNPYELDGYDDGTWVPGTGGFGK